VSCACQNRKKTDIQFAMQRISIILLSGYFIVAAMAAITPTIQAQTADDAWGLSQRDFSVGARMTGMSLRGYTGFGDYSALFSNPAGLGYIDNTQLIASLRGLATDSESDILTDGFAMRNTITSTENSRLGNLAVMYDVPVNRGKLVVGAGFAQVHDFSRSLNFSGRNTLSTISTSFLPYDNEYFIDDNGEIAELNDLPFAAFNAGVIEYFKELHLQGDYPFYSAVKPGTLIEQSGLATEFGEVYELNGGVAWQATKDMMVGTSVNVVFGDYNFDYLFTESDINNENTDEHYNVLLDDGSLLEGFDELRYHQRLDTDVVGVNFRVGISTNLGSQIRLGVSLESPTWTYIEESYSAEFATQFDRGGEISYGDQLDDIGNGTFDYSIRTPWRLGVGLQFNLGRAAFIGEGELIDWAQLHLSSDQGREVFRDVNGVIEEAFGISLNYAFGVEIEAWGVDLRAGLAVKPSPYKNLKGVPSDEQQFGERLGLSIGGGGNITNKVRIDIGLQGELERDLWDVYPSDADGLRQETPFQIDEVLERAAIVLELTVKL